MTHIPEDRVINTLGRSMPVDHAFLIVKAAHIKKA